MSTPAQDLSYERRPLSGVRLKSVLDDNRTEGLRPKQVRSELAVARATTSHWSLLEVLADVDQRVRRHLTESEAPGGLFDEVVTLAPRLAHRAASCRQANGHIRALLAHVWRQVDGAPGGLAVRTELDVLEATVISYLHDTGELLQDALLTDLGVCD